MATIRTYPVELPRELRTTIDRLLNAVEVLPVTMFKVEITISFPAEGTTWTGRLLTSTGGVVLTSTTFVPASGDSGYILLTFDLDEAIPDRNRGLVYGVTIEAGIPKAILAIIPAMITINGAGDSVLQMGLPTNLSSPNLGVDPDIVVGATVQLYTLPSV